MMEFPLKIPAPDSTKPLTPRKLSLASDGISSGVAMLSSAAVNKSNLNLELCSPSAFVAMPSIAYRLAKVAAGDGVCGVSLYPVFLHMTSLQVMHC